MATTPRDRLDREKRKIEDLAADPDARMTASDREALLEYADALDDQKVRHKYRDADGNVKTLKPRTIDRYLSNLRICVEAGFDLLDTTADEFNDFMDHFHDDVGKSKATLATYQAAGESFYRYHDDFGVNTEAIEYFTPDTTPKHDEMDMFTEEEVQALRQACGETKWVHRNRALLELLIFTGQRISALVTLRIGDVDVQEGYIYLNDTFEAENGGLKGALQRGRKRPMFGARKYVRDWIEYHPNGDDSNAWLFIGDPNHWKTDPDDYWADVSADHVMRRIGTYAGIDKPVNAHNFRHYFATIMYRDYDLDRDTIRMLLGHVKGSSALEKTYSHLFDDDYIRKAEEALGYREKEQRSPFTPETCPTCGELLEEHWRRCPACDERFAPGEEDVKDMAKEVREEVTTVALSEDLTPEEREGLRALLTVIDDPAVLARKLAESAN
jgi:integrase